jgi:hypothetical protein
VEEDYYYQTTVRRMVDALLEVYDNEYNETQWMEADAAVRSTFRPPSLYRCVLPSPVPKGVRSYLANHRR